MISPVRGTALACLGLAALLSLSGHYGVWISPDTASFAEAVRAVEPLGQMRAPLYGWLINGVLGRPGLLAWLPWIQVGLFDAAALWVVAALQRFGLSWAACTAMGLVLVMSNTVLLWGQAVLPELPGHAAVLAGLALSVEIAAGGRLGWRLVGLAFLTALAWSLRASLLPFVVLLPLLAAWLSRRPRIGMWLLVACLAPVLGLSTLRLARVADFNVTSFGGFQMSGMAALMLTPAIVGHLPAADQATAREIMAGRDALVADGRAIGVPVNSTGQQSFRSAAVFYFDILARSHDTVLYGAVAPRRGEGEAWPAFNARLQRLAIDTVIASPIDYVAWVIGGSARLVGHAVVLNAMFAVSLLLLGAVWALPGRAAPRRDLRVLGAISLVWFVGTASLVVLTTFPASRYIDSAGMLLPVWSLYFALLRLKPSAGRGREVA